MKGIFVGLMGKVSQDFGISIKDRSGKKIVSMKVSEALRAYRSTFKDF